MTPQGKARDHGLVSGIGTGMETRTLDSYLETVAKAFYETVVPEVAQL